LNFGIICDCMHHNFFCSIDYFSFWNCFHLCFFTYVFVRMGFGALGILI
jgi:hypothetical protein